MNLKSTGLRLIPLSVMLSLVFIPSVSSAEGWEIQPTIEARTGWSDNIDLEDSDSEDSGNENVIKIIKN